ncbi:GTPase HflX [Haloimpatiens sp. FM7315]|uniref:GTPase HflX n=1 Tax=Haloimpatiens sp. FM7315 TaxID=3298609 RepID=UPI0035A3AEE8
MIQGNIKGIRKSVLERLEGLYDITLDKESIISYEIVKEINELTYIIKKEISVYVNRRGKILNIVVGNFKSDNIEFIEDKGKKLSGIRIIRSNTSGKSKLTDVDISELLDMKLDAIISIGINESISEVRINIGFCDLKNRILVCKEFNDFSTNEAIELNFCEKIIYIDKLIAEVEIHGEDVEKAILVGKDSLDSLEELKGLSLALGFSVVYEVFQKKNKINQTYYTGEGKARELSYLRQIKNANLVIFDDELSGSKVRNLEDIIGCKVIDRTTLIFEIFARRAKTRQSKLQVELAVLKHRLSRLRGFGGDLDKIKGGVGVKGGIGSRGPGEKKLEMDRRHIDTKIQYIKEELQKIVVDREVQSANRKRGNITEVALVGYTNAGKSTLRNKLCEIASINNSKSSVFEADMLFATLDTTVRAIELGDNRKIALADTVGFIRKLPLELVEAFKSTLDEVLSSELLLHVVDASSPKAIEEIKAVNTVLYELNSSDKNCIVVLNKIDKASKDSINNIRKFLNGKKIVEVSAKTGENLLELLKVIKNTIYRDLIKTIFYIPFNNQGVVSTLYENCNVIKKEYSENGTYIKAELDKEIYEKFKKFELL